MFLVHLVGRTLRISIKADIQNVLMLLYKANYAIWYNYQIQADIQHTTQPNLDVCVP